MLNEEIRARKRKELRDWLWVIVCCAVALGAVFAWTGRDTKQSLIDEAFALRSVYGYSLRSYSDTAAVARVRSTRDAFHANPTRKGLDAYRGAVAELTGRDTSRSAVRHQLKVSAEYARKREYQESQRALDKEILRGLVEGDWSRANDAATRYRNAKKALDK